MSAEERVARKLEERRRELEDRIDGLRRSEGPGLEALDAARERSDAAYDALPKNPSRAQLAECARLDERVLGAQGRALGTIAARRRLEAELAQFDSGAERERLMAQEERFARLRARRAEQRAEEQAAKPNGLPRGRDAVLAAARAILGEDGPLHYRDILKLMRERKLAAVTGEKPEKTVAWYLNKAVNDPGSGIERVGPGTYGAS